MTPQLTKWWRKWQADANSTVIEKVRMELKAFKDAANVDTHAHRNDMIAEVMSTMMEEVREELKAFKEAANDNLQLTAEMIATKMKSTVIDEVREELKSFKDVVVLKEEFTKEVKGQLQDLQGEMKGQLQALVILLITDQNECHAQEELRKQPIQLAKNPPDTQERWDR